MGQTHIKDGKDEKVRGGDRRQHPAREQGRQRSIPTPLNPSNISLRAVQASCNRGEGMPTVIKWTHGSPKKVFVEGTFTNWGKGAVELQRTDSEHMALLYLQPGVHTFRFIVDGQEMVDGDQPKIVHEKGEFNTISVQEPAAPADSEDEEVGGAAPNEVKNYSAATAQERECYSQIRWQFEETRKLPPLFPPHLRFTPLSTPAEVRPTQEQVLPTPYHVTINHMYFQARDEYNVIGSTFRHGEKYTSVVYYRTQQTGDNVPAGTASLSEQHADPHSWGIPVPVPGRGA